MSSLGGGIQGKVEASYGNTLSGSEVAMKRKILRKAFKTNMVKKDGALTDRRSVAGPFRAAFHLGDPLGRKNFRCGGCNQVNDVNSNVLNSSLADGVSTQDCDKEVFGLTPKQVPLEGINSKFVADSSLYTKFKHLSAVNLTYNDSTAGGDEHHSTFSAINRVRQS